MRALAQRYQPCSGASGRANNREELVFKDIILIWVTKNIFTSITQIHTSDHPFVRLYGTRVNGQRAFDVAKMVRGNFHFRAVEDNLYRAVRRMAS
jgi:hypothetical protein